MFFLGYYLQFSGPFWGYTQVWGPLLPLVSLGVKSCLYYSPPGSRVSGSVGSCMEFCCLEIICFFYPWISFFDNCPVYFCFPAFLMGYLYNGTPYFSQLVWTVLHFLDLECLGLLCISMMWSLRFGVCLGPFTLPCLPVQSIRSLLGVNPS